MSETDPDRTFEIELSLVVTQNGEPWYSNISEYSNLPQVAVLAIEEKLYKVLGELLQLGKSVPNAVASAEAVKSLSKNPEQK